jgi:adenylate cyclase
MRHFATKMLRIKVKHSRWWLACLVSIGLLAWLSYSPFALNLEQKTGLRWLFHWRGAITPPADIQIVALNSTAAENLNLARHSSVWPRQLHAELIHKLTAAQARLIVMDIAFKESRREEEDLALEQAIAAAGNVVLFKYLKRHQLNTGTGLVDIEEEIAPLPRFARHALAVGSFVLPKYPAEVSHAFLFDDLPQGWQATQPLLSYLALQPENLQAQLWSRMHPHLTLPHDLAARAQGFFRQRVPAGNLRDQELQMLQALQLPNPVPINFYGGPETLHTLAFDRALNLSDSQTEATFAGKIVYIGYSDNRQTEQQDAYRTVFSDARGVDISGVEISATVLANLQQKQYLREPNPHLLFMIGLTAFLLALVCNQLRFSLAIAAQILCAGVYALSALRLFTAHYLWLPVLIPLVAMCIGNGLMWTLHYQVQKRREREIRFTLGQYLPGDAAQHLSRNFNRLEQQRQLVQGVCLLTDIQGYTRLAESLPPGDLHTLMNRYYAVLIRVVKEQGGFIGNLVGDGMLALWTGPAITPHMCASALQAALEIRRQLALEPDLVNQLPTCFGLHGGQFSLGNLGSSGHFEYSPVGDMINTAARIEHLNRNLGTRLLCSGPVAEHLNSDQLRFLGNFQLRNKAESVAIYGHGAVQEQLLTRFKQAYENYQNQNFGLALAHFTQMADEFADGPSAYYAGLCQQKLTGAPP